ncbi:MULTISPECIES: sensor histidine kinase [unclassified Arcicella]|uniref:sensor histidine kinase n=1 Tax=unclassified Arcicella TaxID=2644986 RepID=UPI0028613344|nr:MULTISPECIES: sensor histidine kinase [unclassified Arcicella]MDR6564411.1 hypothetical protein [Arcicella sp. BE51]MDR6825472.1 hypothetical protein [Arcicella sp. BE139]
MKYLERYSFLIHILGWLVFILAPISFFPFSIKESLKFYPFLVSNLINNFLLIGLFYFNLHWLTPNTLQKGTWGTFIGLLLGAFIVMFVIDKVIFDVTFDDMPRPRHDGPPPLHGEERPRPFFAGPPMMLNSPHFLGMFVSFILVVALSSVIALWRERTENKAIQQQIIYEKIAAELAVLKLQVSPHFLFNTLNNIRWLARQKSEQTEGYILKLSDLLRYMIYHANHDKVAFSQEIKYLNDYIDLQRMRLIDPSKVIFEVEGDTETLMIEPMLFIPFVENAFKYGVHSQQDTPIEFRLSIKDKVLHFYSKNDIFTGNSPLLEEESGIGIPNVKKRLALHYPDKHQLSINTEWGQFEVNLLINLSA